MSLVLEGTLSDVGLCDLLHLIAREKRSGALRVTIDGCVWNFALRDGQLTGVRGNDGECPAIEPSLLGLVRHRRGAFRLEPPRADDPEGDVPITGVQAEVLAGVGEQELVRLAERMLAVGGAESHPVRDAFPTPQQMEALEPDARNVFALVNAERSLSELIVRSRLDPIHALDALEALTEAGLVSLSVATSRPSPHVSPLAIVSSYRDWIAAALPLALLLAWLVLSAGAPRPVAADPFQIRNDPMVAARAAHELERLRAAVEAYRFAEGRWPEELRALVARGYVAGSALTDEYGRPYYYSRRDDELVLLAPER